MAASFHARIQRGESVAVLAVGGDIGPSAQTEIRALLIEALAEPAPADFVLDLTAVTFIDHHDLAIIEFARRAATAQGIGFSLISGRVVDAAQQQASRRDRRAARRQAAPNSIYMDCRLCWRRITLLPERVQIIDGTVVYRCQHCDGPFLVRSDDAADLGITRS
jgi:anti-anti-sigma factor